jgi:hypothetical protein
VRFGNPSLYYVGDDAAMFHVEIHERRARSPVTTTAEDNNSGNTVATVKYLGANDIAQPAVQ